MRIRAFAAFLCVCTFFVLGCEGTKLDGQFGNPSESSGNTFQSDPVTEVLVLSADDEVTFRWDEKLGTSEQIYIDYGTSLSSLDCKNATNTAPANSGKLTITGLTPNTSYYYKICAGLSGQATSLSDPLSGSLTTRPVCDYTLTPLWLDAGANGGNDDGIDSFDEFETFINAMTDLDNSDGLNKKTVCLQNVTIRNTAWLGEDRIDVNNNDVYIMGKGESRSLIDNQREDATQTEHTTIFIDTNTGLSLANLKITSRGYRGIAIDASADSSFDLIDTVEVVSFGDGTLGQFKSGIFLYRNAVINLIKDTTVITHGSQGAGITFFGDAGNTATVNKIENSHFIHYGNNSRGIHFEHNNDLLEVDNLTITLAGTYNYGIFIGTNGGSIQKMSNSKIELLGIAGGTNRAIAMDTAGYFDTAFITNNIFCSQLSVNPFDFLLYDSNTTAEYSGNTNSYNSGSNFGVQTFPWGDSSDTNLESSTPWNLQTQWGGVCP